MEHFRARWLLPGLRLVTGGVVVLVGLLLVLTFDSFNASRLDRSVSSAEHPARTEPALVAPREARHRFAAALRRHDCSTTGFGDGGDEARSALILRRGKVRHVGLERGWAVYTGRGSGRFVALCRSET